MGKHRTPVATRQTTTRTCNDNNDNCCRLLGTMTATQPWRIYQEAPLLNGTAQQPRIGAIG